ncbi:hypothetical protein B0H67DRAFT_644298 [Lasiosphaeris hirsuta]|uniref:Uncharacterized protein n=1 Tax=Lasiosphaeris hirsuta TaxID=260670 RepID=A0AA40E1V3_9PEZI|nr:hypothetical protein B0H67DRAFT_644298 [Lasiosphaeris hirsuta]
MTGEISPSSQAFIPAFDTPAQSSISHLLRHLKLPPSLLATADFARTIHRPRPQANMDAYQLLSAPYRIYELTGNFNSEEEGTDRHDSSSGKEVITLLRSAQSPFFLALLGQIRHDYANISDTYVGCILMGDVLTPSEFSRPSRAQSYVDADPKENVWGDPE